MQLGFPTWVPSRARMQADSVHIYFYSRFIAIHESTECKVYTIVNTSKKLNETAFHMPTGNEKRHLS
jgi:hypothetical protein